MSMRVLRFFLFFAILAPLPAFAGGFGYNYVDVGFGYIDTKNGDGDGLAVDLSAAIRPHAHIFAAYSSIDGDTGFRIGFGVKSSLNTQLDLVGRLAWVDVASDDGLELEGGVRTRVSGTELNGGVFLAAFDNNDELGAFVGFVSPFLRHLSFVGDLRVSDNFTMVGLGLRLSF